MEPVPNWEDGVCIVLKTALGSFMNHSEQLFNMQISGQEELEESQAQNQKTCILDEHIK